MKVEQALERVVSAIEKEAVEDFRARLASFIEHLNIEGSDDFKEGWRQARDLVQKFATEGDR